MQQAWENLNDVIRSLTIIELDERTPSSRDLLVVKELCLLNLDAETTQKITNGTPLHFQKMSNLCVYFATLSAFRHEIKNLFNNLISEGINESRKNPAEVFIPAGKKIYDLLVQREFDDPANPSSKIPNSLSFERMFMTLIGCVSPQSPSETGQNF